MRKEETRKAFADCDRAVAKVADDMTGRFDLGDVRSYLKREMKKRLLGQNPEEFIKLHKEERAKKLAAALEAREDTIDEYIEDAAQNLVRRWDRQKRVNLEQGTLFRDALIPLDEDNIRITTGRAGPTEWTTYFKLIKKQAEAQQKAANRVLSRVSEILAGFREQPGAATTEDLFARMGWKFDDLVRKTEAA
jgi:hypothetical protein